jgi:hypothetical protein
LATSRQRLRCGGRLFELPTGAMLGGGARVLLALGEHQSCHLGHRRSADPGRVSRSCVDAAWRSWQSPSRNVRNSLARARSYRPAPCPTPHAPARAEACGIWETSAGKIPQAGRTAATGYKLATYQSADSRAPASLSTTTLFDAAKLTRKAAYATVVAIWRIGRTLSRCSKRRLPPPGQRRAAAQGQLSPRCAGHRRSIVQCELCRHAAEMAARQAGPSPIRTRRACGLAFIKHRFARQSGETVKIWTTRSRWTGRWSSRRHRPRPNIADREGPLLARATCANDLGARPRRRPHSPRPRR